VFKKRGETWESTTGSSQAKKRVTKSGGDVVTLIKSSNKNYVWGGDEAGH